MEEIKKFPAGAISKFMETYGGEGSGNFGHAGKKGQLGGSAKKGSGKEVKSTTKTKSDLMEEIKTLLDSLKKKPNYDEYDAERTESRIVSLLFKSGFESFERGNTASLGPNARNSQMYKRGNDVVRISKSYNWNTDPPKVFLSVYDSAEEIENNIDTYSSIQVNFMARRKMLQGKQHMIVPVVMMVEGVHAGSHGPLFHSMKELGKFPDSWNGIPVTVGHPQIGGQNVSANSPEVIEQTVGKVFNTRVENNKLKAEVWLDEQRLQSMSPETMAFIQKGNNLEVSIGVFTDEELVNGEWNGEIYKAIAKNHRPDHLALLPGERGACSWNDGCGVRVNKFKKEDEDEEEMEDQETEEKDEETKETPLKKAVKKFNFKNYVTKE